MSQIRSVTLNIGQLPDESGVRWRTIINLEGASRRRGWLTVYAVGSALDVLLADLVTSSEE